MKQFFLFLSAALFLQVLHATVRTVNNLPAGVAQFNTISDAIAASADGDSILVHGSPNQYSGFSIANKRLTIIGPGWGPNKALGFTAIIQQSNVTGTASSGTEIQGLVFVGSLDLFTNHPNNMKIIRNQFAGVRIHIYESGTYSGYLFEGNYFDNAQIYAQNGSTTFANFIFQNNWFTETGCCWNGNITGFQNTSNVLFNHNLFSSSSSGTRNVCEGGARFLTFTNNIFVRRDAANGISNSTFTNNLTFGAGNNAPWNANGNINTAGNIEDTDPQMTTSVAGGVVNPTSDFSIAAGPANNAATDGKDLGLLYDATGSLNWANCRNSRLPLIFSMNITTPTVTPGGNVQVNVEARRSN